MAVLRTLPVAFVRRAKKDTKRLETIVGGCLIDGGAIQAKIYDLGHSDAECDAETEAHSMEAWYSCCFNVDCRGDVFAQAATRAREFAASLIATADKLDAESKRRPKIATVSRRAGDAASA